MGLAYGTTDSLECIQPLAPHPAIPDVGGPPCLGYHTVTEWLGAPYWFSDEGYVITTGIGKDDGKQYIPLTPENLKILVDEGVLTLPLPAYEVSPGAKFAGFTTEYMVGAVVIGLVIMKLRDRARRRTLERATR
jgi:hypothetical protein